MGRDVPSERGAPPIEDATAAGDISQEDLSRAGVYALLAKALIEPLSDDTLTLVRGLEDETDDSDLGRALQSLGALAVRTPTVKAEQEYSELFFGLGAGGEMTPYGSFYKTGFVYEKPLADLRQDMTELGIERSGETSEPEDHIATLCEIMHGLITGAFGAPATLARQREFFHKHLATWAGQFFEDLEGADAAVLYMPLGTVGKLFMTVEAEAFEMAA